MSRRLRQQGNKMTTKVVAPKLRFKEFQNDWNHRLLGAIYSFKNGVNAEKSQYGSGYKFINVLDIINNDYISYESIIGSVNISDVEFSKNEIKYGDILFQRSSETREDVGQSNVYLGVRPVTFGGFVIRGRAEVEIDPIFSHHLLKTSSVRDQITQRSGGATRYNIGQESLSAIPICTPELPEQTKIANFLTTVDAKISQLTKKYELLSSYKKGVMQKIFNQELRFKDDDRREFPEWELTTIGEISSKITAGGTPSTLKKEYWGGSIRWMNSGELNLKVVFEVENRITQAGLENSSTKLIPKNCVLIGLAGQGKTRGTVAMNLVELCTNQSIAAILPNPTIFNTRYLYQNLEARYDELRSLSAGDGGRGGLNLQIIKSMEISLPCLDEQIKIANFLAAIDDKIMNVKAQLEAAKEYKQGLLQQMFV
ncbi:restriction endonuclease subunit S [Polynucleobacter sp. UK-Gri1-W3]|uniref:restriction endonuclease subunit S n=1 Tax=Polynucleobacter sp. UK-Gri1-W3 TaxID=1819737 RepID=UPI001C0CF823|nr:restriction endonuclease subunit S [Polynucleobacter sp. UK-Gri1-W3]